MEVEHGEQPDMKQKHDYVRLWLEKMYAGESIPDYEINSQTVDMLYRKALESETRENQARVTIQDWEQKTEEYAAETSRLQAVNDWMGLNFNDISPSAVSYGQTLASVATTLDLKDCSDTSFCLSLSELCQQRLSDTMEREEIVREGQNLQDEIRRSLLKQANQNRVLGEVAEELKSREPIIARQKKEAEFLKQKASQYQKLVTSMKDELQQIGYEPNVSPSALQQSAKEIEDLQSQLGPLKAQLASFQDLPPDVDLAKVKVEEARRRLARLEEEFSRNIDLVHAEK